MGDYLLVPDTRGNEHRLESKVVTGGSDGPYLELTIYNRMGAKVIGLKMTSTVERDALKAMLDEL